jgi:hypothetical protein
LQPPPQRLAGQQLHDEEVGGAGDVGVEQADQARVADPEAGAGLALQQLDGGRLVLPVVAEHLDGAGAVGGAVAAGVDRRQRPAAEVLEQLVAWKPR